MTPIAIRAKLFRLLTASCHARYWLLEQFPEADAERVQAALAALAADGEVVLLEGRGNHPMLEVWGRPKAPPPKELTERQLADLRKLAMTPDALVKPGILGLLRRRGLVGKKVEQGSYGQRTTSPLTDAGRALLGIGR